MLKKMRRRVILAAMAAFSSVIILVAVLVNVVNYYVVTLRADETLSYILDYEEQILSGPQGYASGSPDGRPFMEMPDLEANYMTRFFIVRFTQSGDIASMFTDYIASIDDSEIAAFASEALRAVPGSGYLANYRYLKESISGQFVIIFLNVSTELEFMASLRNLSAAVAAAALALVFVLVWLFSGRAIKPIVKNIERQKQFITDASHELKTPITSISASIDVVSLEKGSDEWTENIKSQTAKMSKLVNELVTLSRLDEEAPLPDKEHFSLSNAAWEIVELYRTQAKAKEKTLTADIADDVSVYGEETEIRRMLSVLLDNAVRYSDENGRIHLTVSKKGNKAIIEVFNTCHFDVLPDASRLFDRFYRPDSSRSSETGGTGIGLAIAKAVADAHGGSISASCPDGTFMSVRVVL